jgi:hypothetical protein
MIISESRAKPCADLRENNQNDKSMQVPNVYCVQVGGRRPKGMISLGIHGDRRGD